MDGATHVSGDSEAARIATSLAESLRGQPTRVSRLGGVLTRQPDYEARHLEMMRYLSALKHGGRDAAAAQLRQAAASAAAMRTGAGATSSSHGAAPRSAFLDDVLHREHETEVRRVRERAARASSNAGAPDDGDQSNMSSSGAAGASATIPSLRDVDASSGLPRASISSLALPGGDGGVSPWRVLFHWVTQALRSKACVALALALVIALNARRFLVLFAPPAAAPATATAAVSSTASRITADALHS
jgi:hypothetical protein